MKATSDCIALRCECGFYMESKRDPMDESYPSFEVCTNPECSNYGKRFKCPEFELKGIMSKKTVEQLQNKISQAHYGLACQVDSSIDTLQV